MKLTIELVPSSAWFQNYRNKHPEKWKAHKTACYQKAGYRCEICGGKGPKWPVEAHEVWEWEDGVQRLVRLIALCPDCHEVKHMGLAIRQGYGERAIAHFMRVNKCDHSTALNSVSAAFALWDRRSRLKWTLDCSILEASNE